MIQLSSRLLARNTALNFTSHILPFLVGILATPFIISGLGTERFGLLSIIWVVLGYFGIFDLGMGRASTKYVAEMLGRGEGREAPRIVWTAVVIQAIFGVAGALLLIVATPFLTSTVLKISPQLVDEARNCFFSVAFALPVVMVAGSFCGVLEAAQRFDLVNAVTVPLNTLSFLLPVIGILLGLGLPGIVVLIFMARIGALVVYATLDFKLMPSLKRFEFSRTLFPKLFAYGGWMAAGNNILNPMLLGLDRLLIGSFTSLRYVAYYSTPYEVVARLGIVPASLTATLFPAFSTLEGMMDRRRIGLLFIRSIKYVLIVLGPIAIVLGVFAREILQIWLGSEFARESAAVMGVLVVSGLINSIGRIPSTLLSGCGRPDIPTKCRMLELPIYAALAWVLISHWGIMGAAVAWTVRVSMDTGLLVGVAMRIYRISLRMYVEGGVASAAVMLGAFTGIAIAIRALTGLCPLYIQLVAVIMMIGALAWCGWKYLLDETDRRTLFQIIRIAKKAET
jgi:O-antigen/teichoic acid export membrane protein